MCCAALYLNRRKIDRNRLHLISCKVFHYAMHHWRVTQSVLDYKQLLQQIRRMLTSEPRKNRYTLRFRAMARCAGRNLPCWYAFFENEFAALNQARVSRCSRRRRLFCKISCQLGYQRIAELRCHPPHVGLSIGIAA